MRRLTRTKREELPRRFDDLVRLLPPQAIEDDSHLHDTIEMIDRLMAAGNLSKGQSQYLETLVQLTQAYEAAHHPIDVASVTGLDSLKHLLGANGMNASDLARLLEVQASMGSKILAGERSLTVEHIKRLAARFRVSPALFID